MDQLPDNSCSSRKQSQTNSSQKKNNRSGNLPGSIVSIQKNKPAEKKTNKCHHNGINASIMTVADTTTAIIAGAAALCDLI